MKDSKAHQRANPQRSRRILWVQPMARSASQPIVRSTLQPTAPQALWRARTIPWAPGAFLAGALLAAALLTVGGSVPVRASTEAGAVPEGEGLPLEYLLDQAPGPEDQALARLLQGEGDAEESAAWARLGERRIVLLRREEALERGLRHNLTLSAQELSAQQAAQAIQEAEAVFDPVFSLALGRSEEMSYARTQEVLLFRKDFQPSSQVNGQGGVVLHDPNSTDPQIDELVYRSQSESTGVEEAVLNSQLDNGPLERWDGTVSVSQRLPWGARVDLTEVTTFRETYYDSVGNSYHAPWTASLKLNLFTPLPAMRGFGRNAAADLARLRAPITRDQGQWSLQSRINTVLLAVDQAYWDLVLGLGRFQAALANRLAVARMVHDAQALFEAQRITALGLRQLEAELAAARLEEESRWQGMMAASRALDVLIDEGWEGLGDRVFLPVGHHAELNGSLEEPPTQEAAQTLAMAQRAEVRLAELGIAGADLDLTRSRNDARPDLSMTANLSLSQASDTYGYKSWDMAVRNLTNPDNESLGVGLNFRRPWGNRALRAAEGRSALALAGARIDRQAIERNVTQEIVSALQALRTFDDRLTDVRRQRDLMARALEQAELKRRLARDVTELELVLKLRDLLQAETALQETLVGRRQAVGRLWAAQGVMAESLAAANGPGPEGAFHRLRLERLAEAGALIHFDPARLHVPESLARVSDAP